MGLTKQYLAHEAIGNFNIIASRRSNISFVTLNKTDGRYVAVGAAENTIIWDVRLGSPALKLSHEHEEVTALCPSPNKIHISIGYADGRVKIFNLLTSELVITLSVHRGAVSVLKYDQNGMQLVSGGQDTDLTVCDIVAQVGNCRLVGHTASITDACFYDPNETIIISSSKDTRVKFWNIETQSCFKTLVDHRSEVWGISLLRDADFLITGSGEQILNVYKITEFDATAGATANDGGSMVKPSLDGAIFDEFEEENLFLKCDLVGSIQRIGKGRCMNVKTDPTGRVLACHGVDDTIELFYLCSNDEAIARQTKRLKKQQQQQLSETESPSAAAAKECQLTDIVRRLPTIKAQIKIQSIDLLMNDAVNEIRAVISTSSNSIKMFSLNIVGKKNEAKLLKSITQPGHQSHIRSLAFSSDGLLIASGSAESLKFWSRESQKCLRTVEKTGYILCCCFVPGDRHCLLGLKSGQLLIIDVCIGDIIEEIPAHKNELWSIALLPDLNGCITGGGDTTVKIWSFELIQNAENENAAEVLSLAHKSTLKLEETVICVRVSPNKKFIAAALIDSTVKIFFFDTFKFSLALYGHKLPVLCFDISYDSQIIATGSADRNVKIWGMDFGNCHRSLFAHDDSVMALQFIPNSHMFWTCGKDGKIKQWDGDTFVKIITMPGHVGGGNEAFSLAIDPFGHYLATSGSDFTIRLFEKTQEPLVLQDVQEQEREEMERKQMAAEVEDTTVAVAPNLKLASRKTMGSEQAAESILECLEIGEQFNDSDKTEIPPLMRAYGVNNSIDYLMTVLMKIRPSDLEETMVILPFDSVSKILQQIPEMIDTRTDFTELLCKLVMFLVRIHQKTIVANHSLKLCLQTIMEKLQASMDELRDIVGTNQYALRMLKENAESEGGVELFKDASRAKKKKDKLNKSRHVAKRAYVQIN